MAVDNREDCYFFIHGGCTKGNLCQYRHSEAVLKTINVCTDWMNTKICNDENCELRHSTYHIAIPIIPQADPRSSVSCYWEQNGGCKKHHCPYNHKAPSFPAFRPPAAAPFNPSANPFTPRPPKVSHNQTLILNKSTPTTQPTSAVVRPEANFAPTMRPVLRPNNDTPRPSIPPASSSGIQIKNISNGSARPYTDSADSFKSQISFKSNRLVNSAQGTPSKSVFDRLSVKTEPGTNKIRDKTIIKKVVKNPSPNKPALASPKDSFKEIKIKTLEEILKEKREKRAQQVNTNGSNPSTIPPPSENTHTNMETKNSAPQGVKRTNNEVLVESKRIKVETPPSGDLDDFGSDFEGADFSDPGDNLLDIDLDGDLADI